MLRTTDIMAAKIAVQLGLASADAARAMLREVGAPGSRRDLVNRLSDSGRLSPSQVELVRHRAALYEHVRAEAVYLRLLEREANITRRSVATLLAKLEAQPHRRRLGEVLVANAKLTEEKDRALLAKSREGIEKEDKRIIERYKAEDFAGVQKPLIPGSDLDPADFKISTLFRSKETQALVDQVDIQALRAEALAALEERKREQAALLANPTPARSIEATAAETAFWAPPAETAPPPAGLPAPTPVAKAEPKKKTGERPKEGDDGVDGKKKTGERPIGMDQVGQLKRLDDYSIVEVLGIGGMGAVFLGQKDGRGEYCAIKVMLNGAAGELELGRFKREIALTRRAIHPNLIGTLDSGETKQGLTYMVVPALAGKELRALLDAPERQGKGLEPALVIKIFKQVLEGMQAVHEQRIVHRDMKPENIFIRAGGEDEVKIMDFGLAKLDDDAPAEDALFRSSAGEVVGSPAYIAPEMVTSDPVDRRTDIYSLGVVLFEMLTGKLPLESETSHGFLTQHLICPPSTLAEVRPDRRWPPGLEDLLARMMAKAKDERPSSCAEVLDLFKAQAVALLQVDAPREKTAEIPVPVLAPEPPRPWGDKARALLGRLLGRGDS